MTSFLNDTAPPTGTISSMHDELGPHRVRKLRPTAREVRTDRALALLYPGTLFGGLFMPAAGFAALGTASFLGHPYLGVTLLLAGLAASLLLFTTNLLLLSPLDESLKHLLTPSAREVVVASRRDLTRLAQIKRLGLDDFLHERGEHAAREIDRAANCYRTVLSTASPDAEAALLMLDAELLDAAIELRDVRDLAERIHAAPSLPAQRAGSHDAASARRTSDA